MITAQIAYDGLSDEARREVDRLVAVLADFLPVRDHAVTASLWADDLKDQGVEAFNGWHYVNLPFAAEGQPESPSPASETVSPETVLPETVSPETVLPETVSPENVVWAIRQATATLRGEAGDLPKALMLRFLLHFVGDVHQPLHCVSRFSAAWPAGDRGGNDFMIDHPSQVLHRYWDGAADIFPPVDAAAWQPLIRRLSDDVSRRVPRQAVPQWTVTDPQVWAQESFALAVDTAYAGITEGGAPSRGYTRRARQAIRRQLALGGYRLGALLNDIFAADAASQSPAGSD